MVRLFAHDDWIAFRSRLHGLRRWMRLATTPAGSLTRGSRR
jgi:hypothetical protein